jgi:hypothetical protein
MSRGPSLGISNTKENEMKNRLLGIVLIGASISVVAGCRSTPVTPGAPTWPPPDGVWKSFTLNQADPVPPHAEMGDKFSVVMRNSAWFFDPGQGMANWKAVGGGGGMDIPMTLVQDGRRQKVWHLDVEITGHPPASDHTAEHKGAFGYSLTVNLPRDTTLKAQAEVLVRGLPQTHAGSAHGVED